MIFFYGKWQIVREQQNEWQRKSRGTKDQLLIDKTILKNWKRRFTGIRMAWVHYKKACDMVPHKEMKKYIMRFEVEENMQKVSFNRTEWKRGEKN